jgi:hypothetical protein
MFGISGLLVMPKSKNCDGEKCREGKEKAEKFEKREQQYKEGIGGGETQNLSTVAKRAFTIHHPA